MKQLDLINKITVRLPLSVFAYISKLRDFNLIRVAALVLVVIGFVALRVEFADGPINMDENIAPAVARSMVERGDLNANWRLAEGIRSNFKRDMHNFYSYNLFAILFLKSTENETIKALRAANVVLQIGALAFIWLALRNAGVSFWRRIYTAVGLAVLPTMAFDAHIARTESLLYFLAAAVIFVASTNRTALFKWTVSGLIVGVGMASKLTFAVIALIFLTDGLRLLKNRPMRTVFWCGAATIALLAGFATTSPYTFIEPNVFLRGVQKLIRQYSTEHLPHSNPGTGLLQWASHLMLFATGITGTAWATLRTPLRSSPSWMAGLAVMATVTCMYFATKPVFFERNISLALMASVIVAYGLPRGRVASIALATSLLLMTYWSVSIAQLAATRGSQMTEWEQANFGPNLTYSVTRTWPNIDTRGFLARCGQGIVGVNDFGDDTSRRIMEEIGDKPIATRKGRFSLLPTSTLNVYLETTVNYYQCRGGS